MVGGIKEEIKDIRIGVKRVEKLLNDLEYQVLFNNSKEVVSKEVVLIIKDIKEVINNINNKLNNINEKLGILEEKINEMRNLASKLEGCTL